MPQKVKLLTHIVKQAQEPLRIVPESPGSLATSKSGLHLVCATSSCRDGDARRSGGGQEIPKTCQMETADKRSILPATGVSRRGLLSTFAAVPILFGPLGPAGARAQTSKSVVPLPSWNDGAARQAILDFVRATTDESAPTYVPPEDRIATFDQDGTLWVEHPLYAQAMFALDRVNALAPQHPEWRTQGPFKAVIAGDRTAIGQFTEQDWARIVAATHAGMSTQAFVDIVSQWLATARHPHFGRPYTELVYAPMLEVLSYLQDNRFKTYVVTGGGQEFVRVYSQRVYGVPPEQVIGSSIETKFEDNGGQPTLMRLPKVFFIDDHAGKAVGINLFIGKRPFAAFGNSAGHRGMLEWTGAGAGVRLTMLVYHDDTERE